MDTWQEVSIYSEKKGEGLFRTAYLSYRIVAKVQLFLPVHTDGLK